EGIVRDQWIRLGQAVVVEHGHAVLLAEPADRFWIQWLARRADATELLWVAFAGVGDRHHRTHRRWCREDVGHRVAAEEIELLVRVEAGFAPVDALERTEPPRAEQRRDSCRPSPFTHPVEALAVLDLMAIDELLVPE